MTGFDLPPVTGYDAMFRQRLLGEGAGPQGPMRGVIGAGEVPGGGAPVEPSGFEESLTRSLDAMRSLQDDVQEKYEGLIRGEDVELHDIMAAASKSEVMFNLMLEVRNKLVEAWEKLSRSAV